MKKLPKNSTEIIENIKQKTGNSSDIVIKTMAAFDTYVHIIFCEPMCDRIIINEFILEFLENNKKDVKEKDLIKYIKSKLPAHKITKIDNYDDLYYNLLSGFTIILVDGINECLSVESRAKLNSGILPSQAEMVIKGPKDAFTEDYQTNLGLVMKRLKDYQLRVKEHVLGRRSQTKVSVLYIDDIVDPILVQKVQDKISKIDIDAIVDSNYVAELITDNKKNVFSDYLSTERPDVVTLHLLNGKIAIIVENTQYAIVIPVLFIEFFHTSEDYYHKVFNVNYTRIIRYIAFIITLVVPSVYIAVTTHNHEAIPPKLLVSFSAQRAGVPFPTIVEALLMLITFEILKESDLRVPKSLGSALSIVGAIVLGQAAVEAGIVSQIMVIVIAITAISGLIVSSTDLVYGIRWWRIIFLLATATLGLIGVFLANLLMIINLSSMKSFGIPYLAPFAPLILENQNNGVFITNKRKFKKRDVITAKRNQNRSAGIGQ
ncbi:MAG: spore germination protein [Mollicutes bacterium]|nr:spore germination protein [Mollicutes bacterium]